MGLFIQQNAQEGLIARQLRQQRGALETSLRRISSGLRVTTSADDPGRVGSITRLNAQIRGVQQGMRNLSDGASLMETVDGGLAEAETLLQRLRELSLIAISEHLTPLERRALQGEADQLVNQLDLVARQTRYQGQAVFGGESTKLHIQGDAGRSTPLQLKLADLRPTSLGRQARYEGDRRGVFLSPLETGELQINGVSIRGTSAADDQLSTIHHAGSALAKAAAINDATHFTGVRAIVGDTEVVGLERIQGVDLSGDRFLKINDQVISGFEVHGSDAGGHLITEINRVSGASGVIARLDGEGRIALRAPDGRNIHVEYSDLAVRDALRFIDAFGDELNLIDTVSLSSPDRALHGKVEPDVVQVLEAGSGYRGTVTASGAYRLPRDHIDYVIQVVEGGPLGTARFRFKAETTSENVAAEDFAFLAGSVDGSAVEDPPGAGRYLALGGALVGGGSYDEGIDRTFTFEVTKAGTTDGDLAERAEFRVTSDVDGLVGEDLLASEGLTHALTEGVTATFGPTGRAFTVSDEVQAPGHNYSGGPVLFGDHTGDFDQDFVLVVSQGGYTDGSAELQLSRDGGATFEAPFPLLPWDPIALNGELSVRFPDRNGRVGAARAHNVAGSFNGTVTSGGTYTGTESIRYGIRVTTAGALDGSARGVIIEDGVAVGGDFALVDGGDVAVGGGATLRLDAGATSLSATTTSTSDGYNERVEMRGPYLGEENGEVIARVRQAGRVDGSARLEYSLDGGATFQGDLAVRGGGAIALDDGLSISFDPAPAPVVDPLAVTSATYAGTARLEGAYTDEEDAELVIRFDRAGAVDGGASFRVSFDGGATFSGSTAATSGAPVDIGRGLSLALTAGDFALDDELRSSVETHALAVGDSFTANFTGDRLEVNDLFLVDTTAQNLAVGTRYEISAETGRLELGDRFTLTAQHSFDNDVPLPLTHTVALSEGVEVNFTDDGDFAVGDEFHIHTRGYTGDPVASGFYTDTLHPTTYIVTVTEEGDVGAGARFRFERADGRSPGGERAASETATLLDEGVEIAFSSGFLSVGDQFFISAGEKLEYSFGAQITLQSEEQIELSVSDEGIGNQIGRLLYTGEATLANEAGTVGNLLSGRLGVNRASSLATLSFADQREAERSLDSVDLALKQIGTQRIKVGAVLNRIGHQQASLAQRALASQATVERIQSADLAQEVSAQVRAALQLESSAILLNQLRLSPTLALQLLDQLS